MGNYKVGVLGNIMPDEDERNDEKNTEPRAFTVELTDPNNFVNSGLSDEFIRIMIDESLKPDKTLLEEHLNRLRLVYTFYNCRNRKDPSRYAIVTVADSVRLSIMTYFGWREIRSLFVEVSGHEIDEGTYDMLNDIKSAVTWKVEKLDDQQIGQLQLVKWDPDDKSPFPQKFEDIPRTLS